MKRTAWRLLVSASALWVPLGGVAPLAAQTRPHYGGTLRVEMRAQVRTLDPADVAATSEETLAREKLGGLVFDSLVRLDETGRPQPSLAISWQHDADWTHWQFRLRGGVRFHDRSPLTPSAVAMSLQENRTGWRASVFGETLIIQADVPLPDMLHDLAGPRGWILRRSADGSLAGTGPFRIDQWEAGVRGIFVANEDYWAGRPYLDGVEVQMGRALRDQAIDLQLGKADIVELTLDQLRSLTQAGVRTWASPPVEWMGLVVAQDNSRSAMTTFVLLEALAHAIDRAAIHNVLLQRQGEPAGGFLPQWLSGYAFLFPISFNLESARQAAAYALSAGGAARGASATLQLAYDSSDALARAVAERIAVNAHDAGINLQTSAREDPALSAAPLRMVRVRIRSDRPGVALAQLGAALGIDELEHLPDPVAVEELYDAEKGVVGSRRVIPLFHLPEFVGLGVRLRNWRMNSVAAVNANWRWEELWLAPLPAEERP